MLITYNEENTKAFGMKCMFLGGSDQRNINDFLDEVRKDIADLNLPFYVCCPKCGKEFEIYWKDDGINTGNMQCPECNEKFTAELKFGEVKDEVYIGTTKTVTLSDEETIPFKNFHVADYYVVDIEVVAAEEVDNSTKPELRMRPDDDGVSKLGAVIGFIQEQIESLNTQIAAARERGDSCTYLEGTKQGMAAILEYAKDIEDIPVEAHAQAYCQDCDYKTNFMPYGELILKLSDEGGYISSDKSGGYISRCPKCDGSNLCFEVD